jgi:hypothetical protein
MVLALGNKETGLVPFMINLLDSEQKIYQNNDK